MTLPRRRRRRYPLMVLLLVLALLFFHSTQANQDDLTLEDPECIGTALSALDASGIKDVNLVIHRSGEPEPCAIANYDKPAFEKSLQAVVTHCKDNQINKYQMETILTAYLKDQLETGACGSTDNQTAPAGLVGHCDMGPLRTTLQPDSIDLEPLPGGSLPCRYYTREGRRIASMDFLVELTQTAIATKGKCEQEDHTCQSAPTLHLYAVPAGRVFMFAPSFVGETFVLDHVTGAAGHKLVLEVISVDPRLFEIYDFFSKTEAQQLIDKALGETDEEFGLHRSRTGATSKSIFNKRTSENAWDTTGPTAMKIKERCMGMLGFDDYWAGHTDGLQILRYQNAQAYTAHNDYLQVKADAKKDPYDYDSSLLGGNRFATILLYMTDLGETDGGETLFEKGMRPGSTTMLSKQQALDQLRASGDPNLAVLEKDSWEESMTAMCRSRLSIQPRAGRAVLFYSQFANGKQDFSVFHGGCPVLNGTKWAANLWVWNAPRSGNRLAPQKKDFVAGQKSNELYVTFSNDKKDPRFANAEIWYQDKTNFGDLGHGKQFRAKTYKGHVWKIKADGETLMTHVISGKEEEELVSV